MVGWPGCNVTCPGFNVNMVRVQNGVAKVIRPGLYGGKARVQHDVSRVYCEHGQGVTWGGQGYKARVIWWGGQGAT